MLKLQDKDFYKNMFAISIPIVFQNLIISSLNVVDMVMVGQLGKSEIAGVGIANQIFFVFFITIFGISSAGGVFTAQYWGKKDSFSIKKILGICLLLNMTVALFFSIITIAFKENLMLFFSKDLNVVNVGGEFMHITGYSFIFLSISLSFGFILRSMGMVKLPLMVTFMSLGLNTILNYFLIFGNFGAPKLGVSGAATATLIARIFDCILLLSIIYLKKYPVAGKFKELFEISFEMIKKYFKTAIPVILNEIIWALGIASYFVIYARMGTDTIAAMNIYSTIEKLSYVIFFGFTNGCAIMIGNKIGEGNSKKAIEYSRRYMTITIVVGMVVGLLIIFGSDRIVQLFNVPNVVKGYTKSVLFIFGMILWIKVSNFVIFIGVLRAGGDTKTAFILDVGAVWLIGVPLAIISGLILKLPIEIVFILLNLEEAVKFVIGLFRVKSNKWITNLTQ